MEARKDAKKYRMKEEDEMLEMRKKMNIFRKAENDTKVTDVLSCSTDVPRKSAQSQNIFVMGERGVTFNLMGDTSKKHEPFMDDTKLPNATTEGWSGGK